MIIKNKILPYQTKEELEFIDITEEVMAFVKESGIKNGIINVQTMHTTSAIILNENEPLLIEDIKDNLRNLASQSVKYRHDDFEVRTVNMCDDECANGHAHCKAVYLPPNVVLNIISSKLCLGQWQRLFFLELDRARQRKVNLQVIGE
ncbi:MAG: secondary thiamine-phosphate synthase enzyme YjbQ [Candidatus Pacebacteria bacterium]|nr:secondary thiamine-phosphate synthase enzyme YjbQ [Candidatus Paceibacterota bacterium]MDD5445735.1 secondary thiamine-phosphate synthase enzyme YjbQ [Candidatus Paceibacterota bacterium]